MQLCGNLLRELNSLLREQGLASICKAAQCKTKIKNLKDKFKRVNDHNSESGHNHETFTSYVELNDILGC